jgi:hypothetical protein
MKNAAALIRGTVGIIAMSLLGALPVVAAAQERPTPSQEDVADYKTEAPGLLAEPTLIERAAIFGDRHFGNGAITNGFYTDFWNMIPGAGWISGGPGYRQWYSRDRVFLDTSAAVSWRGYKAAQARFELPRLLRSRLLLGSQVRWRDFTQVPFFGEGAETVDSSISEYRLKSSNLVGYATLRPVEWMDVDVQIGLLKPSVLSRTGPFKRDRLDTRNAFPGNIVFAVPEQPDFVHQDIALTADTRDFPGRPTRGGLVRAAAADYADRDAQIFSFRHYEAEAAGFVPVANSRAVLALHGWLATSDTDEGQFVPFYLQPSLGGHNSLRSYADFRFHDRSLMLVNAEVRLAMMTHVDAAGFVDAGNVGARVRDLDLAKRSYGAGLRLHSRRQTYARLDIARGGEGWRFVFRFTDPLNLTRISERTAPAPFVP